MDILTPLFANSGLSGAVLAALFGLIFFLLRNQRIEHEQYMALQRETNAILLELSGLVREFKGMSHRGQARD